MLFRPEEVHGASGVGYIIEPLPEGHRCIGYQTFRFSTLNHAIFHHDPDGRSAVKAGSVYLDRFSGKEPADRQRLKPSLTEPLLLPINRYTVLGGKVVERRKGDYVVRVGEQPAGDA